ncbi:hypothetical protein HZA39_02390 [Candidatus Peregrinibacteria bacterium]|nr:hypothetical protein [Candidatus Peregrinibacteria bacterium]
MNTIDEKDKKDIGSDKDLYTKSGTIRIRIKKPDSFFTGLLKGVKDRILQVFKKDQEKFPKPIDNHEKTVPLYLKKDDIIATCRGESYFYIVELVDKIVGLRSLHEVVLKDYEFKFKKSKSPTYKDASTITSGNYLIVSRGGEIKLDLIKRLLKKKK